MALWPGIATRGARQSSSVAFSRAGGGSLSERALARAAGPAYRGYAVGQAGMRRQLRLRRRKEFDAVFRQGRTWANELLVLRSLPNELDHNRYGFVTSKRLGKAVVRNLVRRRLREGVRSLPLRSGWDLVISAKAPAARASFQELKTAVAGLMASARILKPDAPAEETG